MPTLHTPMKLVAVVYALFAALLVAVSGFADGGNGWTRFLIGVVHPVCGLGLLVQAFSREYRPRLNELIMALLSFTVTADFVVVGLIATGRIDGDWSVPLVLASGPMIGGLYGILRRVRWDAAGSS